MSERLTLRQLFRSTGNPIGLSILTVLVWLAWVDGSVSEVELEELQRIGPSAGDFDVRGLVALFENSTFEGLLLACEILQDSLDRKGARLLLQLAIGMAVRDRYLRFSENHALRFLADLVKVRPGELAAIFAEVTGREFPAPGDPSSRAWWEEAKRQSKGRHRARDEQESSGPRTRSGSGSMTRRRAVAILGLDEGWTTEEAKAAFRRLSRVHHPDRFHSLGPEAVEAASLTFRRIRSAYEYLSVPGR